MKYTYKLWKKFLNKRIYVLDLIYIKDSPERKIIRFGGFNMKMTEPCNLGLLALISAAGEISYEELKQRYLPPEQPGVIQGVTASFDNDIKTLEKEKYISVHGNIIRFIRK